MHYALSHSSFIHSFIRCSWDHFDLSFIFGQIWFIPDKNTEFRLIAHPIISDNIMIRGNLQHRVVTESSAGAYDGIFLAGEFPSRNDAVPK